MAFEIERKFLVRGELLEVEQRLPTAIFSLVAIFFSSSQAFVFASVA